MNDNNVTWGSHVPVNIALLKTFSIDSVLELGTGHNSTPIFKQHTKKLISVEQDRKWLDMMETTYPADSNHRYKYIDPDKYHRKNSRYQIDENTISRFKEELKGIDKAGLLFIDCFKGFRYDAYETLKEDFDIIVLHDYTLGKPRNNFWKGGVSYSDDCALIIDKTYNTHTAIVIKKELLNNIEQLKESHASEVEKWASGVPKLKLN